MLSNITRFRFLNGEEMILEPHNSFADIKVRLAEKLDRIAMEINLLHPQEPRELIESDEQLCSDPLQKSFIVPNTVINVIIKELDITNSRDWRRSIEMHASFGHLPGVNKIMKKLNELHDSGVMENHFGRNYVDQSEELSAPYGNLCAGEVILQRLSPKYRMIRTTSDATTVYGLNPKERICVQTLVAARANLGKICDNSSRTVLHHAAEIGDPNLIELLIRSVELGALKQLSQPDVMGLTPLHRAAAKGNSTTLKILIDARANVNDRDVFQQTALHRAAARGYYTTVLTLLEAKANVEASDEPYGQTALHWAADAGTRFPTPGVSTSCNRYPIADDPFFDEPLKSIGIRNIKEDDTGCIEDLDVLGVLQILLSAKAPVGVRDKQYRLALHWASQQGQCEAVKLLLENQSDPGAIDINGKTSIDCARLQGHEETVAILFAAQRPTLAPSVWEDMITIRPPRDLPQIHRKSTHEGHTDHDCTPIDTGQEDVINISEKIPLVENRSFVAKNLVDSTSILEKALHESAVQNLVSVDYGSCSTDEHKNDVAKSTEQNLVSIDYGSCSTDEHKTGVATSTEQNLVSIDYGSCSTDEHKTGVAFSTQNNSTQEKMTHPFNWSPTMSRSTVSTSTDTDTDGVNVSLDHQTIDRTVSKDIRDSGFLSADNWLE